MHLRVLLPNARTDSARPVGAIVECVWRGACCWVCPRAPLWAPNQQLGAPSYSHRNIHTCVRTHLGVGHVGRRVARACSASPLAAPALAARLVAHLKLYFSSRPQWPCPRSLPGERYQPVNLIAFSERVTEL